MTKPRIAFATGVFAFATGIAISAPLPGYTVVEVTHAVGADANSQYIFLNDSGLSAGSRSDDGFRYTTTAVVHRDGHDISIGALGLKNSLISAINRVGNVCGAAYDGTMTEPTLQRAFVWRDNQMTTLSTEEGWWSWAFGLDDRGSVVGVTWMPDKSPHAVVWSPAGRRELPPLTARGARAFAITNTGIILGMSYADNGDAHSVIWRDGAIEDLGTLGGNLSDSFCINDSGVAVGYSRTPGNAVIHAFRWSRGKMEDIGARGWPVSRAEFVNNAGDVVGYIKRETEAHAVVWNGPAPVRLDSLIPARYGLTLIWPSGLNERGQILVQGHTKDHEDTYSQFLLTPVGTPLTPSQILKLAGGLEVSSPQSHLGHRVLSAPLSVTDAVRLMKETVGLQ